jgi:DnaJ family protein C protein 8
MADRAFDRIFSQAVAAVGEQCEAEDPERQRERRQASAEDGMRRMTAGMTAADAITRILLADRDKDYFRCAGIGLRNSWCLSHARSGPVDLPHVFLPWCLCRSMLELPQPELDALGRAAWGLAPADVSRAYRKLSILVHPDKNPGEEARRAFEALNQAHRLLKDAGSLVGGAAARAAATATAAVQVPGVEAEERPSA